MAIQDDIISKIKTIARLDEAHLKRSDLGSKLTFEPIFDPIRRLQTLYKEFPLEMLRDVPDDYCQTLKPAVDTDSSLYERITKFEHTQTAGERIDIVEQFKRRYFETYNAMAPYLYSHTFSKGQRIEEELKRRLTDAQSAQNDIHQILHSVRDSAAKVGVNQEAVAFQSAADAHQRASWAWLVLTVFFFCTLVATVFMGPLLPQLLNRLSTISEASPPAIDTFQLVTTRVLLFAVFAYMLYFSARNTLANRHNSVVNRHRQKALQTFGALVSAGKTQESSEIILTHASACIFAPQPTGFTGSKQDINMLSPLLELARSVSPKS